MAKRRDLTSGDDVKVGSTFSEMGKTRKPKYTLEELLKDHNAGTPLSEEERAWMDAPIVGNEVW
ncbi:hypothetical protein E0H39_07035 [Rhizobium leguminosarum bv. viciae]|uniref:hypothetical protein n=1 Tax=Rhizobium leguminosarum TaxID=384 RepID=UPI00103A9612|nr:hypothetical protein [Rhizobium leguminosarum]TBY65746.1 hypothetical protein E0H39_07035 [Rhizobium leguminosarum bv. viciae]